MLNNDTKTALKAAGFNVDELIAAVTHADEQEFNIPEIITKDSLVERDKNTDAEGFKRGKTAGIEIANKAVAKKFSIELAKPADVDELTSALTGKITTGDATLKEQIELLKKDKNDLTERERISVKRATDLEFDTQLLKSFPAGRKSDLSDAERLMLIKANLNFGQDEDGQRIVTRDGNVLRDPTTKSPILQSDAIANFFTERKWLTESEGGRGGNDNTRRSTTGITNISQAKEAYLKNNPGKALISPEFSAYAEGLAKSTTDFNWYE